MLLYWITPKSGMSLALVAVAGLGTAVGTVGGPAGTTKCKTNRDSNDVFYEVIVSYRKQDFLWYNAGWWMTSRVRKHKPFWPDESLAADHDVDVTWYHYGPSGSSIHKDDKKEATWHRDAGDLPAYGLGAEGRAERAGHEYSKKCEVGDTRFDKQPYPPG